MHSVDPVGSTYGAIARLNTGPARVSEPGQRPNSSWQAATCLPFEARSGPNHRRKLVPYCSVRRSHRPRHPPAPAVPRSVRPLTSRLRNLTRPFAPALSAGAWHGPCGGTRRGPAGRAGRRAGHHRRAEDHLVFPETGNRPIVGPLGPPPGARPHAAVDVVVGNQRSGPRLRGGRTKAGGMIPAGPGCRILRAVALRRWSVSGWRRDQGRRPGNAMGGRGRCPAPAGGTGGATPPGVGPAFCRLPAHEARELKKTWRGRVPPPGEVDGRRHAPA